MQCVTENSKDPCAAFLDDVDMWLASELNADHSLAMQAHHDACPACRLETRLARQINIITTALPAQVCPELQSPVIKESQSGRTSLQQRSPAPTAVTAHSCIAHLLLTWRQPLVFVPALALVLATLLVIQLRVSDIAVEPQIVIIDGREYTREEITRATDDLELALRYLDKYTSYPAQVVQAQLEESRLPLPPPQTSQDKPSI